MTVAADSRPLEQNYFVKLEMPTVKAALAAGDLPAAELIAPAAADSTDPPKQRTAFEICAARWSGLEETERQRYQAEAEAEVGWVARKCRLSLPIWRRRFGAA